MRKLFYMFIGLGLSVSCSNNPDDGFPEPQYDTSNGQHTGKEDGNGQYAGIESSNVGLLEGTYNVSWVVDRQEVDTATLFVGETPGYMRISHFPMGYFLNLIGIKVEPAEISYSLGESDWKFDVDVVGYSTSNAYLQNSAWAPQVWFQVNGNDYSFLLYMNLEDGITLNHYTSLMYDVMKDMWSGATPVYEFKLVNHKTDEHWERYFATPINMTFQTTGRKE